MTRNESDLCAKLVSLIEHDAMRLEALTLCAQVFDVLNIPDWYFAAGFVRNLVWDHLHRFNASDLQDIDVIFFCDKTISASHDNVIEQRLTDLLALNWSVKNQARMHLRNHDKPYLSCIDAMSYWPEQQTAVGVNLKLKMNSPKQQVIQVDSVFGLSCLFDSSISHNIKRDHAVFMSRVEAKQWLSRYPLLKIKN